MTMNQTVPKRKFDPYFEENTEKPFEFLFGKR